MRIVVVADVHANLLALQAVFADAEAGGVIDQVWSLGDMVGYGAEPRQTIELLKSYPLRAIAGNHDLAATGAVSTDDFNPFAAEAARWNTAIRVSSHSCSSHMPGCRCATNGNGDAASRLVRRWR